MATRPETQQSLFRQRRCWIPLLTLSLQGLCLLWIWFGAELRQLQSHVIATEAVVVLGFILILLWALFLTRLSLRSRGLIGCAFAALGGLGAGLLEIRGVTGDFVPIIGWRLGTRAAPPLTEGSALPTGTPQDWLDWPQFLGPQRDGSLEDTELAHDWELNPPRELWRIAVGPAWSGFAVSGRLVVTQEQRGTQETVSAYELHTGQALWTHAETQRYHTTIAGEGPRATPTVAGERVLAMGATGVLVCLERSSGALLWRRDTLEDSGAENLPWGQSCSPLVVDGLVIVAPGAGSGSTVLAFALADGALRWSSGDAPAAYASASLVELAGRPQVLAVHSGAVAGYSPNHGEQLFSASWNDLHPNVAQATPVGSDRVLVSTGYGVGAGLFQLQPGADGSFTTELLWRSRRLKSKFSNFTVLKEHVYGLDDGMLTCVSLDDGQRVWKAGRYGHGQLVRAGDTLLISAEDGGVALVEASPSAYRELARVDVLDGKTWNSPALAAPFLLVRNDVEAVCLELPLAPTSAR